jgi:hypothetical protein
MLKGRRCPAMPNAIPTHEEEIILAESIARPTLGARRLLEHLEERRVVRSASGVHKVLRRHNLGTRRQRVAALAALTAADTGLVAPRALEHYGFCLFAARPGFWSAWTASTSASSRASDRSGSSRRWTPLPGGRSAPSSSVM